MSKSPFALSTLSFDKPSAGEVAIDLQRVGNHCKDIAAELHKVKTDSKDRTPSSATLQLQQQTAALSDQLQKSGARSVLTCLCYKQ